MSYGEDRLQLPDEVKPDKATTYFTNYSTDKQQKLLPKPPLPYETWDESTAYVEDI